MTSPSAEVAVSSSDPVLSYVAAPVSRSGPRALPTPTRTRVASMRLSAQHHADSHLNDSA